MGENIWCVKPETVTIELVYAVPGGPKAPFWIRIKKRLNTGEVRRMHLAGLGGMTASRRVDVDWRAMGLARAEMYLTDWSLADGEGNKFPLDRAHIEALDPDVFTLIEDGITRHIEAMEAEKKAMAGAAAPSATSA